jgi:hypothetical protein
MPKAVLKDMGGQKFGRLTVISRAADRNGRVQWTCICECGKEVVAGGSNLRQGKTQSCGCLVRYDQNKTHGMTNSPEYGVWSKMRRRCSDPAESSYPYYGGRGIRVCDRWQGKDGFANFLGDMGRRPSVKHQIDRIDSDGNYEPANCRWATKTENIRNRSNTKTITLNGVTKSRAEWSELYGIPLYVAAKRERAGWKLEDIFSLPVGTRRKLGWKRNRRKAT